MRVSLVAFALVLAACGTADDGPVLAADATAEAHAVVEDQLRARIDRDWDRVYDLTADHARPHSRSNWTGWQETGPPHKCVGDPTSRAVIDLETVATDGTSVVVGATVWEQSDQARHCLWEAVKEPDGWRVGDYLPRQTMDDR
jgi:hypothetical protein